MSGVAFILALAIVGAFFVAFNNGANDIANAFASAVGSKALKIKHALVIAAFLNVCGAVLLGANVSKTLVDGIVNVRCFHDMHVYIAGMISCMLAAGVFIFLSTHTGLPVSSTHAIVGGMIGIALVIGSYDSVNWASLGILVISWMLTPFLSAMLSFSVIKLIRLTIYSGDRDRIMQRACDWIPLFATMMVAAVVIAIIHSTKYWPVCVSCMTIGMLMLLSLPVLYILFKIVTQHLARRFHTREFGVEHVFRRFQAGISCLIGFAIGSNDVANSVTPVVAIYFVTKLGSIPNSFAGHDIPLWLLAFGGLGMSIGVLSLGHKVIGTLGHNITLLTNSKGFAVDFSTAITIIIASVFGMPISSTHAATGSVIGVGLEKGFRGLKLPTIIKIFIAWLITVPMSALLTVAIFFIIRYAVIMIL